MEDNQKHIIHHEGQSAQHRVLIRKRCGILPLGPTVATITHDGFLNLEVGYFARESYRYYLQNASIAKKSNFLFVHRCDLNLNSNGTQKTLRLPPITGSRFFDALSTEMNNVQELMPRSNENTHGFPPKRKLIDWIITILLVASLLVGGYFLFRNTNSPAPSASVTSTTTDSRQTEAVTKTTEDHTADTATKAPQDEAVTMTGAENADPAADTAGPSLADKVGETMEEGRKLWESFDRSSVWNSVLPHTLATSDLALSIAFIVIFAVLLSIFMPARIMRFITLLATLVCVAVMGKVIYQLDFSSSDLLWQILYATAPLLLALVMAQNFYIISRKIGHAGYHPAQRIGYLVSFVLFLTALWLFAYGNLYHCSFDESQLPSIYPVKILQLGDSGYVYVTAGVILVLLVLGSILKVRRCAGNLAILSSLAVLGHLIYSFINNQGGASFSLQRVLPAGIMLIMLIVSIIIHRSGKKLSA